MPYSKRSIACCVVLLAACAGAARPVASTAGDAALPAAIETAVGVETNWGRLLAEGTVELAWLRTLDDPELENLAAEALRYNRELAQVTANLDTAEQLAAEAGAALAAAIAGGSTDDAGYREATSGTYGAARNLQWEADTWSRLGAIATGNKSSPASRADLEAARLSLVAQTAKAWFLAAEANLQLELSRQAIELRQQALQIARNRQDDGGAASVDIATSEAELEAARERQRLAIGALIQALRSIEVILGRYPSAELLEVREIVPVPAPVPAGLPATLLERRPDLAAARRRVAAAFAGRQAIDTVALPRLPLTAPNGAASAELLRLLDAGSTFFSRAENFLVEADSGAERVSSGAADSGQRQTALAYYGALAQQAFDEVGNRLDRDIRLRRRAASLAATADDIAATLAADINRGDRAASDPSRLLRLETSALDTRIRLIRVQHARLAQRVDLYLALGGGFGR